MNNKEHKYLAFLHERYKYNIVITIQHIILVLNVRFSKKAFFTYLYFAASVKENPFIESSNARPTGTHIHTAQTLKTFGKKQDSLMQHTLLRLPFRKKANEPYAIFAILLHKDVEYKSNNTSRNF